MLKTVKRAMGPWGLGRALLQQQLGAWACLVGLWLIGGSDQDGLGPYLEAVAGAALSWPKLLGYMVGLTLYSVAMEWALRQQVQRRLMRRGWTIVSRLCPALLYGASHLVYHPVGALYALALGLWSARTYARIQRWGWMALWHVQWNAAAVLGTLTLALLWPGAPRDHALMAYKTQQVRQGTLVRHAELGWLDRHHDDPALLARITRWAQKPQEPLTLQATLRSQWGTRHPIARTYQAARSAPVHASPAQAPDDQALERWALACSVYLDFQDHHERAQAQLGWWSGLALSAWQGDDLSAAWWTCARAKPGADRGQMDRVLSGAPALERWRAEGLAQLRRSPLTLDALERQLEPQDQRALSRARLAWHLSAQGPHE